MMSWTYETVGGIHFRHRATRDGVRYIAEAKRVPFVAASAVFEPAHHDVWFEFADTPQDALGRLKAQLLN